MRPMRPMTVHPDDAQLSRRSLNRDPRFTGANGILRAHRVLPLAFSKHADSLISYNRLVYAEYSGTLPPLVLAQAHKLLLSIVLFADALVPMMLGLGLLARKGEKAARAIKGRRADREECFSEYATSWAECKSEWKELNEQERAQSRWMYDNCEAFAASVDPWSTDPISKRPAEPRTRLADLPGWIPPSVDFLVGTRAAIALQVEQIYRSLAAYSPEVWATPEMGDLDVLAEQWAEVEELSMAEAIPLIRESITRIVSTSAKGPANAGPANNGGKSLIGN